MSVYTLTESRCNFYRFAGLIVVLLFGHSLLLAQSRPRLLTPDEESKLQRLPVAPLTPERNRTLRLKAGESSHLDFFLDVLKIESSETKTVNAWPTNLREVVVDAKKPGEAILTVFTARDIHDTVGEPMAFKVVIVPSVEPAFADTTANRLPHYTLRSIMIADTVPKAYLWTVDGLPFISFKSLSSPALRGWVNTLPLGAQITWTHNESERL